MTLPLQSDKKCEQCNGTGYDDDASVGQPEPIVCQGCLGCGGDVDWGAYYADYDEKHNVR